MRSACDIASLKVWAASHMEASVRHQLKGIPSVALIGAGQLASEIVPWLISKADLTLFCRNSARAKISQPVSPASARTTNG